MKRRRCLKLAGACVSIGMSTFKDAGAAEAELKLTDERYKIDRLLFFLGKLGLTTPLVRDITDMHWIASAGRVCWCSLGEGGGVFRSFQILRHFPSFHTKESQMDFTATSAKHGGGGILMKGWIPYGVDLEEEDGRMATSLLTKPRTAGRLYEEGLIPSEVFVVTEFCARKNDAILESVAGMRFSTEVSTNEAFYDLQVFHGIGVRAHKVFHFDDRK